MLYLAGDYPLGSLAFILIYSFSSYCALLTAWSLRQRTLRHATLPVRFPIPDKSGDDRLLSVCFGPPFPIKFADCVDTFTYCFLKTAFQRNRARIYCLTRPGLWAHVYTMAEMKLKVMSVSDTTQNRAVLRSPILSSSNSSPSISSRTSLMSKGAIRAPQLIRIDFAVFPIACCQGPFNTVHKQFIFNRTFYN